MRENSFISAVEAFHGVNKKTSADVLITSAQGMIKASDLDDFVFDIASYHSHHEANMLRDIHNILTESNQDSDSDHMDSEEYNEELAIEETKRQVSEINDRGVEWQVSALIMSLGLETTKSLISSISTPKPKL